MCKLVPIPAPAELVSISPELRDEIEDLLLDPDIPLTDKLGELRIIGVQVEIGRNRRSFVKQK